MRIARYTVDDTIHYGVVELEVDQASNPETVSDLTGDPFSGPVKLSGVRHNLADVRLLAPVIPRSKVIGLTRTCASAQAPGGAPDSLPGVFLKPNTSVIGPGEPIQIPQLSSQTAAEAELAIVIGRICRCVPAERVPEVVFGYTCANDVTAEDHLTDGGPWGLAKCWDSFTPLGPWIVTHLSLEEVSSLTLSAQIGGQRLTSGSTKSLIMDVAGIVSFVSSIMTLLPGDVILTGAPGGSTPIRAGQEVSVEIEEIGVLNNPVIGEA